MKKIREKYRDQDEEDKELAMQLLQKTTKEDSKKNRKKQERLQAEERKKKNAELNKQRMNRNAAAAKKKEANLMAAAAGGELVSDEDNDDDDQSAGGAGSSSKADVDMLDSLTGLPVAEDSILFAVPVVAPYSAMINFRYKVKVTPGSSKRGKAAKTALNVFLSEGKGQAAKAKAVISQRDKDLLKSVKDQDLARNLPGKVKVSTMVKK